MAGGNTDYGSGYCCLRQYCDGTYRHEIFSYLREDLIADSTSALLAHQFDGLVMIPNCDKNVPGLLMAAARVNIPTIFVSGGPMLAGHVKGQKDKFVKHV